MFVRVLATHADGGNSDEGDSVTSSARAAAEAESQEKERQREQRRLAEEQAATFADENVWMDCYRHSATSRCV